MKNQKGITLIALIITIIVMLILVAVTLSIALGDNGIIAKAREARVETEKAQTAESELTDAIGANKIDNIVNGGGYEFFMKNESTEKENNDDSNGLIEFKVGDPIPENFLIIANEQEVDAETENLI